MKSGTMSRITSLNEKRKISKISHTKCVRAAVIKGSFVEKVAVRYPIDGGTNRAQPSETHVIYLHNHTRCVLLQRAVCPCRRRGSLRPGAVVAARHGCMDGASDDDDVCVAE
jgi:hypothetical protein